VVPNLSKAAEQIEFRHKPDIDHELIQQFFLASSGRRWGDDLDQVLAHSFTWVTAHDEGSVVGFVHVAWDGGVHFFLLDPTVLPSYRHRGIGTRLVNEVVADCRGKGDWMHVDAVEPLMTSFYLESCGFEATPAGVINLREPVELP
jgi:GNAT superfamily N-acetyltransferase